MLSTEDFRNTKMGTFSNSPIKMLMLCYIREILREKGYKIIYTISFLLKKIYVGKTRRKYINMLIVVISDGGIMGNFILYFVYFIFKFSTISMYF